MSHRSAGVRTASDRLEMGVVRLMDGSVVPGAELRAVARLALPIMAIQVGMLAMGIADIVVVGHLSAEALAAVSLGNLYFFGVMILGIGVLLVLDPLVAQAVGNGDREAVSVALQRGILLSLVLTVVLTVVLGFAEHFVRLMRQPEEIIPSATEYVRTLVPGVWPILMFSVLRQTLQAHRQTRLLLGTVLAANLVNVVLSIGLVFGVAGLPALGVRGAALATLLCRWFMFVMLLWLSWPHLRPYLSRLAPNVMRLAPLFRMLKIGLPIGVQMLLEWGTFSALALLMGWVGVTSLAAHQVATSLVALAHALCVGLGAAVAVLVGQAVGGRRPDNIRRLIRASFLAVMLGAGLPALVFASASHSIASLYTTEEEVVLIATVILPIAAGFVILNGVQVVVVGILRGFADTFVPMLSTLLGLWCVALPLSWWLAFQAGFGVVGLWLGLVAGIMLVAVFLLARLMRTSKAGVMPLVLDA